MSVKSQSGRLFVYLAYVDDSDTKSKNRNAKWQVMSAVMISDSDFHQIEFLVGVTIEQLIPPEKFSEFTEFHACELYGGYGVFDGIEQPKRFAAIKNLVHLLEVGKMPVIYGGVDLTSLVATPYGSANPKDIAFRVCINGVEDYMMQKPDHDMALLITDECEGNIKKLLQTTFRSLRRRIRPPWTAGKAVCLHDDMYFGDSRFSIGLQLTDLCAYFIARHLDGDPEIEGFYQMIEPYITYSRLLPDAKGDHSSA